MKRPNVIRTPRLKLTALDARLAALQIEDRAAFFDALGVHHEPAWPPELLDAAAMAQTRDRLAVRPDEAGWHFWALAWPGVAGAPDRLVGAGGFKGAPDADGVVEVGYSMLISFREQGLATEAVDALLDWAYADTEVRRVIAHTLPHLVASRRVLEKTGFVETGKIEDAGEEQPVIAYEHVRREQAAA